MLRRLLEQILLEESINIDDITSAIDNKERVILTYKTKGEDAHTGARVVEVYAYGLTKAGNPVIRCFQPYGDTTTKTPNWKFFRLDRIESWKPTGQKFSEPADQRYPGYGDFNPDGDETMSVVYKVADFSGDSDDVYRTDTERRMERLKQQTDNPITADDMRNAGKQPKQDKEVVTGPRVKKEAEPEIYRTETERGMEKLRNQLNNPRKIDLQPKKPTQPTQPTQATPLSNQNIRTMQDLNNALRNRQATPQAEQPYKTETERGIEKLRQQLNNPRKINLDTIPKK